MKAAIVLFNVNQTGASEAHFALPDAARCWPFSQGYTELERKQVKDPAIDINGPTWEITIDRVQVMEEEKVGDFLTRE